jgi:ABC-type lipoprotein release transport system permease subunit
MQRYLPKQEIMGFDVAKGTVHIGALLARNIPEGESFKITGKDGAVHEFKIAKRLGEGKGMIDQGVAFYLEDLQLLLGMEGRINKIEALGCVCHDGRIKNARNQVTAIFPDLEVTEISNIADARENQRVMMNKYGSFIIPFVILSSLLISGLMFYANVMARRNEIGLMKAIGKSRMYISSMILLKACILGLLGSIAGFFAGTFVAGYFGKEIFRFTAEDIGPLWNIFGYGILIFPVLWMLSSWIPALLATQMDAARILSQE